jgi:glycine/D-amino acid oxidase-like deaminating enzyme
MKSVVVVGAGLAGLTTALYLERAGLEVQVLEASDRVGGRVATDNIDGFLCDRGFQVINPNYSEIKRLSLLDDLNFKEIFTDLRIVDRHSELKVGLSHLIATWGVASLKEKFFFLKFLAQGGKPTLSFGQASGYFPDLYSRVLAPFLAGVFLTNPDEIRSDIANQIIRSFILGRPGVPELGVGQFSERLAAEVSNISLNATVHEIKEGTVSGEFGNLKADAIVIASDSTTAAQLLDLQDVSKILGSTTWYHSIEAELADSNHLAAVKNSPIVNSVVISKVCQAYAPTGKHLVSTTCLANISESEIRKELSRIWKAETTKWDLVAKYDIKQSLPFRNQNGAIDLPSKISDGVYVVGDHRNLPSQNGAMRSGRLAALEIIKAN